MKSLPRFLVFVVAVALCVAGIYLWRSTQGSALPAPTASSSLSVSSASVSSDKMSVLSEIDRGFTDLVNRAMPSVVSITAIQQRSINDDILQFFGGAPATELPPQLGSGVIVSREGHIVTNLHVIGRASSVQVHLNNGRTLPAEVLGADPLTDLAILKIDASGLAPLALADSDKVRVGQMVIAVGNPYGLQETVTRGIISAKQRRGFSESTVNEFFQTDAAVNPGNSGGPLLDLNGDIIAINNSILSEKGGWQGISFAIPANTVRRVFNDIRAYGHVIHTWFGVITFPLTKSLVDYLGISNQRGVFVYGVLQDSPAQKAGIQPGDVLTDFNGKNIFDGIDLRNRIANTAPGQKVSVRFLRNRSEKQVDVTIEKRPSGL